MECNQKFKNYKIRTYNRYWRSGNDIIYASIEPWKEIEDIAKKTTGHYVIFIGDHIYIITGGFLYLYTRRKYNNANVKTECLVPESLHLCFDIKVSDIK